MFNISQASAVFYFPVDKSQFSLLNRQRPYFHLSPDNNFSLFLLRKRLFLISSLTSAIFLDLILPTVVSYFSRESKYFSLVLRYHKSAAVFKFSLELTCSSTQTRDVLYRFLGIDYFLFLPRKTVILYFCSERTIFLLIIIRRLSFSLQSTTFSPGYKSCFHFSPNNDS